VLGGDLCTAVASAGIVKPSGLISHLMQCHTP
jgi:hypothetical protein